MKHFVGRKLSPVEIVSRPCVSLAYLYQIKRTYPIPYENLDANYNQRTIQSVREKGSYENHKAPLVHCPGIITPSRL